MPQTNGRELNMLNLNVNHKVQLKQIMVNRWQLIVTSEIGHHVPLEILGTFLFPMSLKFP